MFNSTAVVESLAKIASSGTSRHRTEGADAVHIATSERYLNLKAFEAATAIKDQQSEKLTSRSSFRRKGVSLRSLPLETIAYDRLQ